MCRAATPKLIEFVCDKQVLGKLISYACHNPQDEANHTESHKFPFYAADVLASNITILQAITEGGWNAKKEEESEEEKKSNKSGENEFENSAENKMVQSILNKQNENVSLFVIGTRPNFKSCRTKKKRLRNLLKNQISRLLNQRTKRRRAKESRKDQLQQVSKKIWPTLVLRQKKKKPPRVNLPRRRLKNLKKRKRQNRRKTL